jgi:hypothetical protein
MEFAPFGQDGIPPTAGISNEEQRTPNIEGLKNTNPKGSHGLRQYSFKLETMTALIKSFCGGSKRARGYRHLFSTYSC